MALVIRVDPVEWAEGYADGAGGRAGKSGGSLSYLSGRIEGDAERQRLLDSAGNATVTELTDSERALFQSNNKA